ncbi:MULTISPECIES: hypothetical protein [unclassified Methanoregula]|uniref:hypothetical protein n=1 Tax=unclassified Methanoregula TaxID=2649730 RepID=UPI0009C8477D|nr:MULTISPECIES: hypothetical protein [unclassified Methanoregula]OPX61943.1 MAG: hypothetical protein A4E33_02540 [Methanoregula sp. PtaB.Bin085]OPY34382.1 MAG: hypothetical protein A4E34_01427 [Methanoregula sp. PtaU1.Bin006]
MIRNQYVRIVLFIGMIAVMCGIAGAATSIGAENEHPSAGGQYYTCSAPCECISENEAAARWGPEGYDRCNKNVCGQSANAMIQYYCLHPIGGSASAATTTCQAPCECLSEGSALSKWGTNGYVQCTKTTCGQESVSGGSVAKYCFRQWGSSGLVVGGAATTTLKQTTAAATAQNTVQVPVQTLVQTQVQEAAPSPTYTWPSGPAPIQTKSPVGLTTILVAIGMVILAFVTMRRE